MRAPPQTLEVDGSYVRFGTPPGRRVLAVTVLGSGLGFLDATAVNVALPAIGADLDAGVSGLQWVLDGYLVTLTALILLGGSLADRHGRRRVFTLGVVAFTAASAGCAAAPSDELLVAARIAQGAGAALLTPVSLAIIESVFAPGDRGRAIGAWSALTGVAAATGPLVGGYLIDAVSWRAIFLVNVPLGLLLVWATARYVPEPRRPPVEGRADVPGAALVTLGLAGVTFALIEGKEAGIAAPEVIAAGVVGALALAVFVHAERSHPHPMLPLAVFATRQFRSANAVTFVVYAALGGVFFLLVVFLQASLGYTPLQAGAASLPVTALMLAFSARAGALAQRIGPRIPLTAGPLLLAAGMAQMSLIDPGDGYAAAVLPAVATFGLGLAATVAPVTATALAAAHPDHVGVASAVNNAVARAAQLLAVAALPLVAGIDGDDYEDPAAFADGFSTAMLVAAALAAAGALIAWRTIDAGVLQEARRPAREPSRRALEQLPERHCAVTGTPVHHTPET